MYRRFQPLKIIFCSVNIHPCIQQKLKLDPTHSINDYYQYLMMQKIPSYFVSTRNLNMERSTNPKAYNNQLAIDLSRVFDDTVPITLRTDSDDLQVMLQKPDSSIVGKDAAKVQSLLKVYENSPVKELEQALNGCELLLTDELVLQVLRRHRSDWKPAFLFFNWVLRGQETSDYAPGSSAYNEILDILGRMKRFDQLIQVFDEMSKRQGIVNERTFAILLNRYAGAHKVDEAIEIFYKRRMFGLELDLIAFQKLLMSLCRYKHVDVAESLFHSERKEFPPDIKSWNIILNGWCVLGSLREAKRFWNDIISSRCKIDCFTYGIFINSLTKAGKLSTAIKLFRSMWEKGCTPDVVICNCVIDALCFKKRIPEALDIFGEMNDRGCMPNVATYNSLIKHLCNIQRMEKVYELLDEMEQKKGCCMPNARTYNYLLKSMKKPEEVPKLLERMERHGCKVTGDTYNLILKLFMDWNHAQGVQSIWVEMERNGVGPDQRSYTIMVHGLHNQERLAEALQYFTKMTSKGMIPEPRTELLVKAINLKLKEQENMRGVGKVKDDSSLSGLAKHDKKKRAR